MLRSCVLALGFLAAVLAPPAARAETSIGADDGVGFGMLCSGPQQMVVAVSMLREFEPGYGDAIKNLGIMCAARDDAWNWAGGTQVRQKVSSPDKNKPMGPWLACPQDSFVSKVGVMRWRIAANQSVFAGLILVCGHPGQADVTVNPGFITDGTNAPSDFDVTELRCLPNGNEQVSFLQGIHGRYAAGQAQGGDAAVTKLGIYCLADAPSIAPAPAAAAAAPLKVLDVSALDKTRLVVKPAGQDFPMPMIGENGVDFCLNWATNCGKPAADAFCRSQGYAQSGSYTYLENRPPTFVIGDLKVCNAPGCTRFTQIYCTSTAAAQPAPPAPAATPAKATAQRFDNPTGPNGLRLYACTTVGGNSCGKPVAQAFCQAQGFGQAAGFDTESEKVQAETLAGEVCNKKKCKVFDVIQCAP